MDRSGLGRISRWLLIFSLLLYIGLLAGSLLGLPSRDLAPQLRLQFAWRQAAVRLIDLLLAVQLAAVLLVSSLLHGGGGQGPRGGPFHALAAPALVRFLLTAAVYGLLVVGFGPALRAGMADLETRSSTGRQLVEAMRSEAGRGEYALAIRMGERAVELLGVDLKLMREIDHLRLEEAARSGRQEGPGGPEEAASNRSKGLSYLEMVRRGEARLQAGDAFTACYYAVLARRLDEDRPEARRLASDAEARIAELTPQPQDEQARALFRRKQQGSNALTGGRPIEAYAIFRELEAGLPGDPEVAFLLGESRRAMLEVSYFVEDARRSFLLPARGGLLFLNGRGGERREVVFLADVAQGPSGTFLRDVEAVGLHPDGRVRYHLRAPYAALTQGHLVLVGVARGEGVVRESPRLLSGALPREEAALIPLRPAEDLLPFFRTEGADLAAEGLVRLWRVRPQLEAYGWPAEPAAMEILRRVLAPFAFLIGSLLALALGWSGRRRSEGPVPPVLALPALLIAPAALLGSWLALAAQRVLGGALLAAFPFASALAGALVVQALLLAAALVVVAGQRND